MFIQIGDLRLNLSNIIMYDPADDGMVTIKWVDGSVSSVPITIQEMDQQILNSEAASTPFGLLANIPN